MSKWNYNCVSYDSEGFAHILNEAHSGFLKCSTCGDDVWCKHIESAITSREDAHSLWAIHQEQFMERLILDYKIQVPIAPTRKLWAEVLLVRSESVPSAMEVRLLFEGSGNRDLGFINKGDGRMVIRQMIFDWFMSLPEYPTCQSSSHGYRQEMIWQQNIKHPKAKYFEYWCTFMYKACGSCWQANTNIDFGDLVPEVEKSTFGDLTK